MKSIILLFAIVLGTRAELSVAGETNDPIKDFAMSNTIPSQVIYMWRTDLNGNGKKDFLLEAKLTPQEKDKDEEETKYYSNPNVHAFTVYIAKPSGSGYTECTGIVEDGMFGPALPEVDITQCYVGPIKEIHRFGLVTVQQDDPRHGPPVARIYAYTVDGDHLKQTKLAEFNPEK